MTNSKQFTEAEVSELLDTLESIGLQVEAIQNTEHLLTDYMEIVTYGDKKSWHDIGYDAIQQFYKLEIMDDYLLRAIESINKSLEAVVPSAYDLYKVMAKEAE